MCDNTVKMWYCLLSVSFIFYLAPARKGIIKKRKEFKKKSGDGDKQSHLLDNIDEFDDWYSLAESMTQDAPDLYTDDYDWREITCL